MKEIITTRRLILREFLLSDADSMFALNADPEVIRYTGDAPFGSVLEARQFLENYPDYKLNGFGRWTVVLKDNGNFLGWCGLKINEEGFVDIGFRFLREYWNRGFATEAAGATLDFGFRQLNLEEIIGRAAQANLASIRVLEKLHMKFWKQGSCHDIDDAMYYRIKRDEYLGNPLIGG